MYSVFIRWIKVPGALKSLRAPLHCCTLCPCCGRCHFAWHECWSGGCPVHRGTADREVFLPSPQAAKGSCELALWGASLSASRWWTASTTVTTPSPPMSAARGISGSALGLTPRSTTSSRRKIVKEAALKVICCGGPPRPQSAVQPGQMPSDQPVTVERLSCSQGNNTHAPPRQLSDPQLTIVFLSLFWSLGWRLYDKSEIPHGQDCTSEN